MVELDIDPGNYFNLEFADGKLFYMSRPFTAGGGRGGQGAPAPTSWSSTWKNAKPKKPWPRVAGTPCRPTARRCSTPATGTFGIVDAKADQKPAEEPLRTGEMQAKVDPRAEWRQMFRDAWRQERDFFYDPGMHGVDWDRMYQRYGQMVPYVAHGADFSYMLGEMIGELNSSHCYVRQGDAPRPKRWAPACWVATFDLDARAAATGSAESSATATGTASTPTPLHLPGQEVERATTTSCRSTAWT